MLRASPLTKTRVLTALLGVCVYGILGGVTVFAQSFASPVNYPTGSNPDAGALGDFNGDGKPDLAVANNSSKNISVLLGNGDGTFGSKTDHDVGLSAYGVVITDLNGDGKLDIVADTAFSLNNNVSVLLGNGNGTFQSRVDYAFSGLAQPNSILASDFNNDGKPDMVVVNEGLKSRHPSGAMFLYCDGSVHFLNEFISYDTYQRLSSRRDGKPIIGVNQ